MRTYRIHKAQRTLTDVEVPDTEIIIAAEIEAYDSIAEADKAYRVDAETLCKALYEVLPGGTFDQLLVEMLRRKASHFRLSYKES